MRGILAFRPRRVTISAVALVVILASFFVFTDRDEPIKQAHPTIPAALPGIAQEIASQPPAISRVYLPALGKHQPNVKIALAWSSTVCGDALLLNLVQRGGSYHNWSPNPNSCPSQPKHIPMWRPATASLWNKPGYIGHALFLNEPDGIPPDGDSISCSAAATYWLQFKTTCPGCRVIALNLVSGSSNSIAYANCWRETIKSWTGSYPVIAGYGVHAYGGLASIKDQIEDFRTWMVATNQASLELWVTEYGGMYGNLPQLTQLTAAELANLLDWLETQSYIQKHFWFPPRFYKPGEPCNPCPNVFFVGISNTLTPLGQEFKQGGYPGPSQPVIQSVPSQESYP